MAPARSDRLKLAMLALATVSLGGALLVVRRSRAQLWAALFDASHVLIGALLAIAALWVLATWRPSWRGARRYGLALAVPVVAGAGLELAQLVAPGEASVTDLLRDAAGGVAGLAFHAAWRREPRRGVSALLASAGLLLMAPGLWPAIRVSIQQLRVVQQLPVVAAFDGPGRDAEVRSMDGSELAVVPAPAAWSRASRPRVGKVIFAAGHHNPRLLINNPFADWSGYSALVITAFSPQPDPFDVILRIDDLDATSAMSDRFHRRITLVPGHNEIRVALDDVRRSPQTRELDLGALENVVIFMEDPARDHVVFVDALVLE